MYLIDLQNVYFFCNIDYISYAYPYTHIQEINNIYCYKPRFHTKQSFSHINYAYLHYNYYF